MEFRHTTCFIMLDFFYGEEEVAFNMPENFSVQNTRFKNRSYPGKLLYPSFIHTGFYVPFTYLPKAAIEKGITRENAAFLLSIIGKGPFTRHGKGAVAVHGKVAMKMGCIAAYETIYT